MLLTIDEWQRWLMTPEGLTYIARRVRAGARAVMAETLRLERWLRAREPFNHNRENPIFS